MSRRVYLALVPFVALVVGGFALFQGYVAVQAVRAGAIAYGAVYAVLAVAGVAIVATLLRLRRQLLALPR